MKDDDALLAALRALRRDADVGTPLQTPAELLDAFARIRASSPGPAARLHACLPAVAAVIVLCAVLLGSSRLPRSDADRLFGPPLLQLSNGFVQAIVNATKAP